MRVASPSQILTVTFPDKGESKPPFFLFNCSSNYFSILEYLSRDDADHAIKELDGKELRGRPVRVTIDESVSIVSCGRHNSRLRLC